jgi:uncharacterized RDD family membrane protein YckC
MGYQDPYGALPTKVMGRRIVAYLVDALIVFAVYAGLFYAMSDRLDNPLELDCQDINDEIDGMCVNVGDDVWIVEDGEALLVGAASLAAGLVVGALLPGLTGASPGKALTGIRVVRADGRPTGIGRGLLRWIVTIADAFPYCIPMLLGFIVAMTSDTRQRLADKAVGSYVVRASAAGRPLPVPGQGQWGGGPPGGQWGGGPPGGQWGPPPGQPWGAPGGQQPWGAPPPTGGGWGPAGGGGQYPPPPGGWGPPPSPPPGQWGSR